MRAFYTFVFICEKHQEVRDSSKMAAEHMSISQSCAMLSLHESPIYWRSIMNMSISCYSLFQQLFPNAPVVIGGQ